MVKNGQIQFKLETTTLLLLLSILDKCSQCQH